MLLSPAIVAAQALAGSRNMELFGHLNPVDTADLHASVWGYAAPDGREYAFFASQIGTHIIDVTTAPIREVAFVPGPRSIWREMKTYMNYLYVSTEDPDPVVGGIQIIDISELPARVRLLRTENRFGTSVHTLYIRDHYLYAMGTGPDAGANGGAVILDLEPDPVNPTLAGLVAENYYHDAWVRNDTLLGAAIWGAGIDIVDISDKATPRLITNINYPGSGTHNVEMTDDGRYLVSSDEIGETPKTMKVWDIADAGGARMVGEFSPNRNDIVHNVHVIGRYVYAAWYTAGVRIIDMADPLHPREVGYYDTYPGQSGTFNGVWEVYGWLPSGKILASDRNSGLYVLTFNGAVGASVSGTVRRAGSGAPIPGASIFVPELDRTILADAQGSYYVGAVEGDEVTLRASRFGFTSASARVTLTGDVHHDIELSLADVGTVAINAVDAAGTPIPEFSYAVEPFIEARRSISGSGSLDLPRDTSYVVTVGAWGYRNKQVPVDLSGGTTSITVKLERRYQDNATLDLGWSYADVTDDAESGRWSRELLSPFSGASPVIPDHHADGGVGHAFVTGDVESGRTSLISPRMDFTGYTNPIISFSFWLHHRRPGGDTTALDSVTFDISNDDGRTWVTGLAEVLPRHEWTRKVVFPAPLLSFTDRMRVRFQARDLAVPSTIVMGIDNFDVARSLSDMGSVERDVEAVGALRLTISDGSSGSHALVSVARSGSVRLELFDALGRSVSTIHDGDLGSGTHRFALPSGLPKGSYRLFASMDGAAASAPVIIVR
jgi:choice-of-anchor B domain-containing protein